MGQRRSRSVFLLRSSATLFLPRLSSAKAAASPSKCGENLRISSPSGRSTLITSAPASASIRVASGPGSNVVKSRTRISDRDWDMARTPKLDRIIGSFGHSDLHMAGTFTNRRVRVSFRASVCLSSRHGLSIQCGDSRLQVNCLGQCRQL
jgi:hypothetical protein